MSNALATAVAVYDTVDEFHHIDFRQSSSLKFQKYPSRVRRWYEKVLKSRLKSGDSLAAAMAMAVLKATGHNPEVDFRRSPPRPSGRSQRKRELQYSIIPPVDDGDDDDDVAAGGSRRSPPRPSGRSQRKEELQYSIVPPVGDDDDDATADGYLGPKEGTAKENTAMYVSTADSRADAIKVKREE